MDFWSRLIGGGGLPSSKRTSHDSAQQRLGRFQRACEHLSHLWRKSNGAPLSRSLLEDARSSLETLRKLLQDESRANAPHLCIEYAASSQAYLPIILLASFLDEAALREALTLLSVLVDREEGNFLGSRAFASAIARLCVALSIFGRPTQEFEVLLLEVLFEIAAKLRFKPDCIQCWFQPEATSGEEHLRQSDGVPSKLRSHEKQFPLFCSLLDRVNHEGRAGEFARTGLLYLVELAAHSESFEKWVIESDLASLMASGLGALYSELSRNLVFTYAKDLVPSIIAFSEVSSMQAVLGIEEIASIELQSSLGAFLDYLMFWQDVLEHCKSADINGTLLEHFELLFLQQLLYPSLLESSDIDGGVVAVLTYFKCILQFLSHAELLNRTLRYLLAVPNKAIEKSDSSTRPTTIARRRKSESLISQREIAKVNHSPELFNLIDLTLTSLQSPNQQTITATLRLLSVLLGSNHQYIFSQLIHTTSLDDGLPKRNITAHQNDIDALLDMADSLLHDNRLELCYENHLKDARNAIESHVCSVEILAIPNLQTVLDHNPEQGHDQARHRRVHPHILQLDDPLLRCLQTLVEEFLTNDIETNLSLTQVISIIASCGYTSLNGWFLRSESSIPAQRGQQLMTVVSTNEEHTRTESETVPVAEPNTHSNHGADEADEAKRDHEDEQMSAFFNSLGTLVSQIQQLSREIEDFDVYLAERRHVFNVGEDIENALNDAPIPTRTFPGSKTTSPARRKNPPHVASISERLLSEDNSTTGSRSSSPRGRQREQSAPTLVGRLSHLRISPSISPSKTTASSADARSSLGNDSLTSTPPKGLRSPISPENALRQKITIPTTTRSQAPDIGSSDSSSIRSGTIHARAPEVTLSHLLTNVVILQEFLLELAAIIEVRAALFGEVTLD